MEVLPGTPTTRDELIRGVDLLKLEGLRRFAYRSNSGGSWLWRKNLSRSVRQHSKMRATLLH